MLGSALTQPLMVCGGYLWPAYQSFKAVSMNNPDQLRDWAQYWVVMGFFLAVQFVTDLTLFWLPLYYEVKILFVLFLWHPKAKGAAYIFDRFLHPMLTTHEARIDATLEETKARVADSVTRQVGRLRNVASTHAFTVLESMRSFSEPVSSQPQKSIPAAQDSPRPVAAAGKGK